MLIDCRAGCNFSAISGSDANALKWDCAGYSHLMKLASTNPDTSYVHRTPSIEMWDEDIPENKIKDMSQYLQDVSDPARSQWMQVSDLFTSSESCLPKSCPRVSISQSGSPP